MIKRVSSFLADILMVLAAFVWFFLAACNSNSMAAFLLTKVLAVILLLPFAVIKKKALFWEKVSVLLKR